jgi:hypothetical protein
MARSLRRRARPGSPYPSAGRRLSSMQWIVFLGVAFILPAVALAQSDGAAVSLTPWGEPDLQGIWDFRTATPLQRPADLVGKTVLTPEEAAAYERQVEARRADYDANPTVHATYWLDYGTRLTGDRRTSLVVVPEDGRIPALTPEAQPRANLRRAMRRRLPGSHEDRSLGERCILSINAGPPMNPGPYNNNVHLLQIPGYVVLLNEMIHDVRVIPLDRRPHLDENIRQWQGDSRGHWEDSTLVVETTNFARRTAFQGSSEHMRLAERFTRGAGDTLLYEYTVEDPRSFERMWSVVLPMEKTDGPMFEYACHEGNYGLRNILANARFEEQRTEQPKTSGSP